MNESPPVFYRTSSPLGPLPKKEKIGEIKEKEKREKKKKERKKKSEKNKEENEWCDYEFMIEFRLDHVWATLDFKSYLRAPFR